MSPIQVETLPQSQNYELDVYGKRATFQVVRGKGSWLWDDQGRRFLDCIAGNGVVNLGHSHPAVLATLHKQADQLISCPGSFYHRPKMDYLEQLVQAAPQKLTRAFLSNSGAEAVEAGLKFARLATGRSRIICAKRGFHGRTFGALSATFHPKYKKGFQPLVPDFQHVSYNDIDAIEAVLDEQVAAVMLEMVQGEGGVFPGDSDYFAKVRQLCDHHGALLVIDEVQTGFGRTGSLFACQSMDLEPDILCLAKAIANGLPMGATLVRPEVVVGLGKHGSTFGGNPLVCAVAQTVLQTLIQEHIPQRAARLGAIFKARIQAAGWENVREVRGRGLMLGLELKTRAHPVISQLMARGVLALTAGSTVLRLLPPLTIREDDLDYLFEVLESVLA